MSDLPKTWTSAPLSEVVAINPGVDKSKIDPDQAVNFVPMPAVEARTGRINVSQERRFAKVKTGYTPFIQNDVLFAKITPCMENGKMAVVPELPNGVGFGSTEFHVFRCPKGIDPRYVYYHTSSALFRHDAEHNMTGAVGQKRVPEPYLAKCMVPVPPANEQSRIVEKIEELFSELDKGVESLLLAREQLKLYRQSVLKHAFEGKLTADWRQANPDKLEDPETLLTRIQDERDTRYKQQLDEWNDAVSVWRANGEEGKKPRKPKRPADPVAIGPEELVGFPALPTSWVYSRLGLFVDHIEAGKSFKCEESEPLGKQVGVAKVSALSWGEYDETESKTCIDPDKVNPDFFIQPGDFLLSRANTIELVGAVVIVRNTEKTVMLSDKTLRLVTGGGNDWFFLHYLRSRFGRLEIESRSTGNQESMRNIGQDRVRSIIIPVCSSEEMSEIVHRLASTFDGIAVTENSIDCELERCEAIRQSILKQAFSGQLVPQDPSDEPASELLARINASAEPAKKPKRKKAVA